MDNDLIHLTLTDMLQNPTGKSSAYMANRKMIIEGMNAKYVKLLSTHKKFSFNVFKNKEDYIFKFKIPSESLDGFYYDVIILFHPATKEIEEDRTLNRYELKLFSNSPHFTYTYTYVLNKSKIIVPQCLKLCSDLAIKEEPTVKNPVGSYGFEKSCYFACRYIKDLGLSNKILIDNNLTKYSDGALLKGVSHQEAKMKEYNLTKQANKKAVREQKREKANNTNTKKTTTKKKSTTSNKKRKK